MEKGFHTSVILLMSILQTKLDLRPTFRQKNEKFKENELKKNEKGKKSKYVKNA